MAPAAIIIMPVVANVSMKEYAKLVAFVRQQNETVPVTVREYVALGRLPHSGSFSLFLNKTIVTYTTPDSLFCFISHRTGIEKNNISISFFIRTWL